MTSCPTSPPWTSMTSLTAWSSSWQPTSTRSKHQGDISPRRVYITSCLRIHSSSFGSPYLAIPRSSAYSGHSRLQSAVICTSWCAFDCIRTDVIQVLQYPMLDSKVIKSCAKQNPGSLLACGLQGSGEVNATRLAALLSRLVRDEEGAYLRRAVS